MARLTITVSMTPPREVMPNAKTEPDPRDPTGKKRKAIHWSQKAWAVKQFRYFAGWSAQGSMETDRRPSFSGPVSARVVVFWEKGRKRGDTTNVEAGLKAMWDGFQDAGVFLDDKQLVDVTLSQGRDPDGLGYVMVELTDEEG